MVHVRTLPMHEMWPVVTAVAVFWRYPVDFNTNLCCVLHATLQTYGIIIHIFLRGYLLIHPDMQRLRVWNTMLLGTRVLQMSTFCVTGDRKNVDTAVSILKRLIAEGNSDMLTASTASAHVGDGHANGNHAGGGGSSRERRDPMEGSSNSNMSRVWSETRHRLGRAGSELSRGDGSPPTAPCRFADLYSPSIAFPLSKPFATCHILVSQVEGRRERKLFRWLPTGSSGF